MGEANFYYFTCLKFIFLSFHPNKTPNFLSNTYFTNIRRDAISHASYHADDGNSCGRHRIYSFLKKHSKVHIRIPHDQWGKGSKVGEEEEDAEEDATTTETETSTTSSALVAMKTSESSEKQQCPICGRMVSQTGLSSHIKDHEAVKCGECGAEFPNRYQKDNHKALVHDKMTFTCPHQDCSKTFFSRKLLKHHFTSVH